MARYNPKRTPERFNPLYSILLRQAPKPGLLAVGSRHELRKHQQHFCLFLRSVRERDYHELYRVYEKWVPQTRIISGGKLEIKFRERTAEDSLTIDELVMKELMEGRLDMEKIGE
jgi:hypothetical protein